MIITPKQIEIILDAAKDIQYGEIKLVAIDGGNKTDIIITNRLRVKEN